MVPEIAHSFGSGDAYYMKSYIKYDEPLGPSPHQPPPMPSVFEYDFQAEGHEIKTKFSTGLFINGKFVDGSNNTTIDVINPTTGKVITKVSEGTEKDVDLAVQAAQKAYDSAWGLNVSGVERGKILIRIAELIERDIEEIAAVEALDNGKAFTIAKGFDASEAAACFRYYGGWADKHHGKVAEIDDSRLGYTRHEPIGVVGQIIPWNFPLLMFAWKLAPALATGNTIIIKPSEFTPMSALRVAALFEEAGLPAGVVNVVTGYGQTVGAAISSHMKIEKVAFTGSTAVGRTIMKAAAASNLKNVTLELGGKSPNIIFNDADLEAAVRWAAFGIFFNHGQCCCAGSRIFVQSGVHDKFVELFTAHVQKLKVGDPFKSETFQGPKVSQIQFDRIMGYIESGKSQGAKVATGGGRLGNEGYFIQPTVFTDVKPDMKIIQEEIFGPVVAIAKFEDEADIIRQANDSIYGLAAAVFSRDISRAIGVAHKLHAGTVWVNCYNKLNNQMPFGGFKQSGIGRELGEYALSNYTNIKSVHVNLTEPAP
ncbi:aldehyde dehydrogenase (NAD+) [Rhizoctonia solani AG-1 IB]|uniref:Aldehyde dehydrogenase (NAD+) n=1 Tax=Thanatephorus cucumeris (strain AG1-IB / isolate 7/3/14) TaxID=1108050 RepID=M5C7U3_THACB|nr:aldehyde dehydrogenase (NAD+) [Rhizoctonia solani AG-1 IB]